MKKFYTNKFSPKIIYPKSIFGEFVGKLFPFVLWPIKGSLGPLKQRGKIFTRKMLSKNYIPEKYVSIIFRKTFTLALWPDMGI